MWRSLSTLENQMDQLFSAAFGPVQGVRTGTLKLNSWQDDDHYYLSAEVPGVLQERIEVSTQDQALTIRVNAGSESDESNERYLRRERQSYAAERTVRLPGQVDLEGVTANLSHGILTVRVPKAQAAKPRQIEIKTS